MAVLKQNDLEYPSIGAGDLPFRINKIGNCSDTSLESLVHNGMYYGWNETRWSWECYLIYSVGSDLISQVRLTLEGTFKVASRQRTKSGNTYTWSAWSEISA